MANGSRLPEGLYEYSLGTAGSEAPNTLPVGARPSGVGRTGGLLTDRGAVDWPKAGSAEPARTMATAATVIIPDHPPYNGLPPSAIGIPFLFSLAFVALLLGGRHGWDGIRRRFNLRWCHKGRQLE